MNNYVKRNWLKSGGIKIDYKGGFLPKQSVRRKRGGWIDSDGTDQPETGKFTDYVGSFKDYI
jgi:hypothetical protein